MKLTSENIGKLNNNCLLINEDNYVSFSIFSKIKLALLTLMFWISIRAWIFWTINDINRYLCIIYILFCLFSFRNSFKYLGSVFVLFTYFILFRSDNFWEFYGLLAFKVIFILFLLNESKDIKIRLFSYIETIYAYILIPSIGLYILHYFITLPSITIDSNNPLLASGYTSYIFFVKGIYYGIFSLDTFRFLSIFDEPGVVGTFCFILLTIRKYRFTNWKHYIILFAGIISFSFFFYLATILILPILFRIKLKTLIQIAIILSLLVFLLTYLPYFDEMIITRLQIVEGGLAGFNRTSEGWDYHYSDYLQSSNSIFGLGSQSYDKDAFPGVASYQTFVYNYGLVGLALVIIIFGFILSRFGTMGNMIVLMSMFLMVFYQRPWIFDFHILILLFTGVIVLEEFRKYDEISKKENI